MCETCVAKRADERACMRVFFFLFFFLLLEETWGLARRGEDGRKKQRGGRGGKNEEGKRRPATALAEREERQNAVAVPVTLLSLENFLWIR